MHHSLKHKLQVHVQAGYPGLFIQSSEEARVDQLIAELASELQLHPKEWNLGYGWVNFDNKQPRNQDAAQTDLANCLPALLDDDLAHKLIVIKDARLALENQPLATARLKQLLNRIQRHHRGEAAVVLVAESLFIPAQIEAQITLLPLPLPGRDEIASQVEAYARQHAFTIPADLNARLHATCSGLSQAEIQQVLAMVRLHQDTLDEDALKLIHQEKEQIIAKSGVLEMIKVSESAEDIGGLENLKLWLQRRAEIFRRLPEATQAGVKAPKGVLIAGMPGCGKSLTAKAAASLFQLPLLRLDIGSLLGKYVGESEHNMRRALAMAESVSPCILWIDELEKAFVGMNNQNASEVSSRLFGYFLTWMQEKTGTVFVIATANNISALPPELLRKGRFDEVFYVGFPHVEERKAILGIHLKDLWPSLSDAEQESLASQCRDYAGADIQNAINEARESAFLSGAALGFGLLQESIRHTVPLRETLRDQIGKYEELFEKLKLKPASHSQGLSVVQMIKMAEDPNPMARLEVAQHGDCPDDLLEKLASDERQDPRVLKAVFANPRCPQALLSARMVLPPEDRGYDADLRELAHLHPNAPESLLLDRIKSGLLDDLLCLRLAKTEHCPAGILRALANAKVARQGHELLEQVLRHPHCPEEVLELCLSETTPATVNTALAPLLRTDKLRGIAASHPRLNESLQLTLTRHGNSEVRLALAKNPALCESAREALREDPELLVRRALESAVRTTATSRAGQTQTTASQLAQLRAGTLSEEELASLASETALAEELQHWLMDTHTESVALALAGNPCLCGEVQGYLALHGSPAVREALARNPGLDETQQQYLLETGSKEVRIALASNPGTSAQTQQALGQDQEWQVRASLAGNRYLSAELLTALWHSSDIVSVRQELAGNPSVDVTTQEIIESGYLYLTELAQNPALAPHLMSRFLQKGWQAREALAKNSSLTPEVMAALASDGDRDVLQAIASNPALPEALQARLIASDGNVQQALAGNPALAPAQQAELLEKGDASVRSKLQHNPALTAANRRRLEQLLNP